ncbi:hypothetical protein TRFO_18971 [Tritrichomonas foetus]|uniref:Uncharacterized protein n=1 Tax=Tritrichomonas foetus TaxID=1144522 RepID=A0A1J4KP96_9EUKA|nr:hypothetical protein TRFO_18971 [Tritrichomonas foetus]|eukprot:OHT11526.1 hypothetical protein TRFO_18971 [Tritrichomonas foetus]
MARMTFNGTNFTNWIFFSYIASLTSKSSLVINFIVCECFCAFEWKLKWKIYYLIVFKITVINAEALAVFDSI